MNWNPSASIGASNYLQQATQAQKQATDRYLQLRSFIRRAQVKYPKILFTISADELVVAGSLKDLKRLGDDPEYRTLTGK